MGACLWTVTWGSGQLISWRANAKRRKAFDAVERGEDEPRTMPGLRPQVA